jgi:coenzyme PQQ precursor peptide PqqA
MAAGVMRQTSLCRKYRPLQKNNPSRKNLSAKPTCTDLRIGSEVTMYFASRRTHNKCLAHPRMSVLFSDRFTPSPWL